MFQPFVDASGHVATTDLTVVGLIDPELRDLMEMAGRKHRSSQAKLPPGAGKQQI